MNHRNRRLHRRTGLRILLTLLIVSGALFGQGLDHHKSGPIQISRDGRSVWAVNPDHDTVAKISTVDSTAVEFPLPLADGPHRPSGLAMGWRDQEVWVAAHDSDRVYVLDASTGDVLASLVFDHGSGPISVAISADRRTALVALHRSPGIAIIDTRTRTVKTIVEGIFHRPFGIAFPSYKKEAWISHSISDGEVGRISVLDLQAHTISADIVIRSQMPKSPAHISTDPNPIPEGGYPLLRSHIVQPPGSDKMWVPIQYQNLHNPQFTPDSSIQAALHKIDLRSKLDDGSKRVVLTAVFAHDASNSLLGSGWNAGVSGPVDIAFSRNGANAYLVCAQSNEVLAFPSSIATLKPVAAAPLQEIRVGDEPIGIVLSPVENVAYVLNRLSRDVSVVDLATSTEVKRIPTTPWTVEPLPANILNGAKLFNTSADSRLSQNEKVACASCHPDGDGDGMHWFFAPLGAGVRKTTSLLGVGLTMGPQSGGRGQLHRGGDLDEVQDFEHSARGLIMGGTGFLSSPNPALAAPNAGLDGDLDDLASYVLALPPLSRSPHRDAEGALTETAVRGRELFMNRGGGPYDVGCHACHIPHRAFTDRGFHDVGGLSFAPELQGPFFNTPSLIGTWASHPLISWTDTVADLLDAATSGNHGNTSILNHRQLRDLEEFVLSIDGDMVAGQDRVVDVEPPRIESILPVSLQSVVIVFNETVDPLTAVDINNYLLSDGTTSQNPSAVTIDLVAGNRVRLAVTLQKNKSYTLAPGAIEDLAGVIGGRRNNAIDPTNVSGHRSFNIGSSVTVTFGDTGHETFAAIGATAGNHSVHAATSFTEWHLSRDRFPPATGFISFDFISTLQNECGVTSSTDILDTSFSVLPKSGRRHALELRRCLLPWGAPLMTGGNVIGTVNRSFATYPSVPWFLAGARFMGGSGTNVAEYHPSGSFDVAGVSDAVVTPTGMNERTVFQGPLVTDAFRFWFDHPALNFGYNVRIAPGGQNEIEYHGASSDRGAKGPILSITYQLP